MMKRIFTLCVTALLGMQLNSNAQNILVENFESATASNLPAGWTTNTGWKTRVGSQDWYFGPIPEHSRYALVDDYNDAGGYDSSMLISPTFDLTGISNAVIRYDYFFMGANVGTTFVEKAYLQISTNGGSSWTVIDTLKDDLTKWQIHNVSLASYANMNNLKVSIRYSDATKNIIGVAVDNIRIYVPSANDIVMMWVKPVKGSELAYAVVNSNVNLKGTVTNDGLTSITSFNIKFQEGSGPVVSSPVTGVSIAPNTTYDFTASNPFVVPSSLGNYNLKIWAELTGDGEPSNDSGATTITASAFMPHKRIFVEEGTGTWCGWCPRGAVYMDSVRNTYPDDFTLAAVHNGDPMVVSAYDGFIGGLISGYPAIVVDRRDVLDPSALIDVHNDQKDYFGYAEITLADVPANGFNYSVKATVKPAIDLSGDYRLALVLTEDDVHGKDGGGKTWSQSNYYSYQSQNIALTGAGFDWQAQPSKVADSLVNYDFVARAIVPSTTGAANSLPASMTANTTYDYTFSTVINAGFNRTKMHGVVILLRNSDGAVLNSKGITIPLGISDLDAGVERMVMYPNPASSNTTIRFTTQMSTSVKVDVMDMMGRTVKTINDTQYNVGTHTIDIATGELAPGLYNVKLQTGSGAVTQRLSVIK